MKAAVKDKKLKEFFKIMTTNNYTNEKMFPKLTKTKIDVNNMELGGKDMSGIAKEIYKDNQGHPWFFSASFTPLPLHIVAPGVCGYI